MVTSGKNLPAFSKHLAALRRTSPHQKQTIRVKQHLDSYILYIIKKYIYLDSALDLVYYANFFYINYL